MTTENQNMDSTQFDGVVSTFLNNADDPAEVAAAMTELLPRALSTAISNAKAGLSSTLINWILKDLSGQLGGFTRVCEVKATISAGLARPERAGL